MRDRKLIKVKKTIFFQIVFVFVCMAFEPVVAQDCIDISKIAILPYDSTDVLRPFKNVKQATLTNDDCLLIEKLLAQCIAEYNIEQEKRFDEISLKYPNDKFDKKYFIIDFKQYKRQYIVVTNNKGEKEVWINCFCHIPFNNHWKKGIITVKDGGNCFFNVKINLTVQKYYNFDVNGDA